MYNGKYANAPVRKPRRGRKRTGTLILSLLLLLCLTIGGTLALLIDQDDPITNTFTPSHVTCTVTDKVDEYSVKTDIVVTNTGDIDAYVRVKLLAYRVNAAGHIIGGTTAVDYTPHSNSDWFKGSDGNYYYKYPVKSMQTPKSPLVDSEKDEGIQLIDYTMVFDANGNKLSGDIGSGKQVIEVVAEAIQADGVVVKNGQEIPAVTDAWGIAVVDGKLSFT